MDIIRDSFNGNRFIPIDSEEMTALELIGKVVGKTNEVVETTNNLESDVKKKINESDVTLCRKLLKNGDFRGSWFGIKSPAMLPALENAVVTKMFETISNLVVYMPEPSTKEENTRNLQSLLDLALIGNNSVTIKFNKGIYELSECYIHSNTTIEMHSETRLDNTDGMLFMNARRDVDTEFTAYNGNGNITIRGGSIQGHCMSMIHGQNILIENVNFIHCNLGHFLEISGCKNVVIRNCDFHGMTEQATDRQYVEYIQIDSCTYEAFPRFPDGSTCFDKTVNDNIIIENCTFKKGCSNLYTAVGSHGWTGVEGYPQKNITVRNCTIEGATFAGVRIVHWDDVVIENNTFIDCYRSVLISQPSATTKSTTGDVVIRNNKMLNCPYSAIFGMCGTETSYGGNILIEGNKINLTEKEDAIVLKYAKGTVNKNEVDNCKRLFYGNFVDNLRVLENTVSDFTVYGVNIIEGSDVTVKGNTFKNASMEANATRIVSIKGVNVFNVLDNKAIKVNGYDNFNFVNAYDSDGGIVDGNIFVSCSKNNKQTYVSNATIQSMPYGKISKNMLYNGSDNTGTIELLEGISKFKNLIITTGNVADDTFITSFVSTFANQQFSADVHNKICVLSANGKVNLEIVADNKIKINHADDKIRQIWGVEE